MPPLISPIRILLACPRMRNVDVWRSILSSDRGFDIVDEDGDPIDILLKTGTTGASVVVLDLPQSGSDPGLYSHLLEEYPDVKVVAVSQDGSRVVSYERGVIRKFLADSEVGDLARLFRSLWLDSDPN